VDDTSGILPKGAPKNDLLCGLAPFPFSKANAPKTVGRSRDEGRFGERYIAASIDRERSRDGAPALDMLLGWLSVP
jgi:hypothetical protein